MFPVERQRKLNIAGRSDKEKEKKLKEAEAYWRKYLKENFEKSPKTHSVKQALVPIAKKSGATEKMSPLAQALIIPLRQPTAVTAAEMVKPEVIQTLAGKKGKRAAAKFSYAVGQLPQNRRQEVFDQAVAAAAAVSFETDKPQKPKRFVSILGRLTSVSPELTAGALERLNQENPDTAALAIETTPYSILAKVGGVGEWHEEYWSPKRLASAVNSGTNRLVRHQQSALIQEKANRGAFNPWRNEIAAAEATEVEISIAEILALVVERDDEAPTPDDPDFGIAEEIMEKLTKTPAVIEIIRLLAEDSDDASLLLAMIGLK